MDSQQNRLAALRQPERARHPMRRDDIAIPYRPHWAARAKVWQHRFTVGVIMLVGLLVVVNLARCALPDPEPVALGRAK